MLSVPEASAPCHPQPLIKHTTSHNLPETHGKVVIRWLYKDLAAVTHAHTTTEKTRELPIALPPSSPQLEMDKTKGTAVCSDGPEQAIPVLSKHHPIPVWISTLRETEQVVWLPLYQIIHSSQDQKGLTPFVTTIGYRYWNQQGSKKNPTEQKQQKKQ